MSEKGPQPTTSHSQTQTFNDIFPIIYNTSIKTNKHIQTITNTNTNTDHWSIQQEHWTLEHRTQ